MLWDVSNSISLLVETSTYCNAKCPQCTRTNRDGLGLDPRVTLSHTTIDDWKATFARSYPWVKNFHFSGQWGDAFMNPHIDDIIRHIMDNSECNISFSTNGSMRDEEFWWWVGAYCRERVVGGFDVDGLTQENHELYRVNTNLKKVMANATAFSEGTYIPGSNIRRTRIFSVVFKHNQGDMDGIAEWADSINARHDPFQSNRFIDGPTFDYMYKGVKYRLEQTTDPRFLQKFEDDRAVRDHRHKNSVTEEISCRWANSNKFFVDQYQNVWPCCYWHSRANNPAFGTQSGGYATEHQLLVDYVKDIKVGSRYNLRDHTIGEIMNDVFYTHELEKSFNTNPPRPCKFICSVHSSLDEPPEEY